MFTVAPALMMGIGTTEAIVVILIFSVPGFFITRAILRRLWHSGTRRSIVIASLAAGVILSPILVGIVFAIIVAIFNIQ